MKNFCIYFVALICVVLLVLIPGKNHLWISIFLIGIYLYYYNPRNKKQGSKYFKYIIITIVIVNISMFCMNALDFYTENCKVGVYEVTKIHKYKKGIDKIYAIDSSTKETVEFNCEFITKNRNLLKEKKSYRIYYTRIYKEVVKIEEIDTKEKID